MAEILERGDIFFLYRPKIETEEPHGLEDVQRFYMVLKPEGKELYRRIIIGRKRAPDVEDHERNWAFVDRVSTKAEDIDEDLHRFIYETATRGERYQPAARPAGEGVYALVRHDDHTHLAYELELPRRTGEVQQELAIKPKASYIIAVKNPEAGAPPGVGLPEEQEAEYPRRLQELFRGRRFAEVEPAFLDREGTELDADRRR